MLSSLSLLDWSSVAAALVLFVGPGHALLSFYAVDDESDVLETFAMSIGLSIAFWPVVLAWLHALGIVLKPSWVFVTAGTGWLIGLARRKLWMRFLRVRQTDQKSNLENVALLFICLFIVAAGLYALRETVVAPGSDGYHHTLIAHMIAERGILPDDYEPFAPLVTFTYHFGFHTLVAVISWLTDLKPLTLVPILGQILNAMTALSVAFFTQTTTKKQVPAILSAAFSGLVSIFPAYFVNWGRYTQLTGLVMLPIFWALIWHWMECDHRRWSSLLFIGLLGAGIALVHYRVALMAAVAVLTLVTLKGLIGQMDWAEWGEIVGRLTLAAALAVTLASPWIVHILGILHKGYSNDVGTPESTYFRWKSLITNVLNYPTSSVLLSLALVAILLGWWRRERVVIVLSVWVIVMLILSKLRFADLFMDIVSVTISLYFPISVIVGWMVSTVTNKLANYWKPIRWVVGVALSGLFIWGGVTIGSIVEPGAAYVRRDDLSAMDWIQSNTPPSAYFIVNTFSWDFLPTYVIGSDAGYWLPLLADRRTVTVPMTYPIERASVDDLVDRLLALDCLEGHLTSPEALALLRREGITHVYIGQRGGPIVVDELLKSPAFDLEYQKGSAYVFRFN